VSRRNIWSWTLLLCAACGSAAVTKKPVVRPPPPPEPTCHVPNEVQLEIEASDRVNPDENGRSLPTRLRLYQLTDLTPLEHANFDDVWTRPKDVLASSVVNSEELVIYPGQVLLHRFQRDDKAEYVAAVAVFREPEGEAWRTAQEWPLPGDPCRTLKTSNIPTLAKLRVRMFLEDNRIESLNNYAQLPKRRCAVGADDCTGAAGQSDLRRNRRLQTFEENPLEPESSAPRTPE
jgi:type VI secretion system protein VasD